MWNVNNSLIWFFYVFLYGNWNFHDLFYWNFNNLLDRYFDYFFNRFLNHHFCYFLALNCSFNGNIYINIIWNINNFMNWNWFLFYYFNIFWLLNSFNWGSHYTFSTLIFVLRNYLSTPIINFLAKYTRSTFLNTNHTSFTNFTLLNNSGLIIVRQYISKLKRIFSLTLGRLIHGGLILMVMIEIGKSLFFHLVKALSLHSIVFYVDFFWLRIRCNISYAFSMCFQNVA